MTFGIREIHLVERIYRLFPARHGRLLAFVKGLPLEDKLELADRANPEISELIYREALAPEEISRILKEFGEYACENGVELHF